MSQNLQPTVDYIVKGERGGKGAPLGDHSRREERDKQLACRSELTVSKQLVELAVLAWGHVTAT